MSTVVSSRKRTQSEALIGHIDKQHKNANSKSPAPIIDLTSEDEDDSSVSSGESPSSSSSPHVAKIELKIYEVIDLADEDDEPKDDDPKSPHSRPLPIESNEDADREPPAPRRAFSPDSSTDSSTDSPPYSPTSPPSPSSADYHNYSPASSPPATTPRLQPLTPSPLPATRHAPSPHRFFQPRPALVTLVRDSPYFAGLSLIPSSRVAPASASHPPVSAFASVFSRPSSIPTAYASPKFHYCYGQLVPVEADHSDDSA